MAFEFVEHTGDTAVRLEASSAESLFREAVRAALALYLGSEEPLAVKDPVSVAIALDGDDGEQLLVDLFAELIWRFDVESLLASDLEIETLDLDASPARLVGRLHGTRYDPELHEVVTEVKAATYHGLSIETVGGGYRAQVVFDL